MNYSSLAASSNSACFNPSGSDLRPAIYTDNSPLLYRSSIQFGNTPKPPSSSTSGAPRLSAVLHPSASGSSTVVSRRKSKGPQQLRRRSNTSLRARKGDLRTGSTYGQSVSYVRVGPLALSDPMLTSHLKLFNSIAVLLGVGMLSEPYAFAQAGWVMGTLLIIGYGALACQVSMLRMEMLRSAFEPVYKHRLLRSLDE